jgi:hypothetical protein
VSWERYGIALALTLAIEVPLVALCVDRERRKRATWDAIFLNLFTHPLANLAYWQGASFQAVEAAVMLTETCGYRIVTGLGWGRAAAIGVGVNVVTAALSSFV